MTAPETRDTTAPGRRPINSARRPRQAGPGAGCLHGVRHATGAPE